jgi:hypothetical protein
MVLSVCIAGCAGGAGAAPPIGTLAMPLAGEVNGVFYRLSDASFSVSGPETFDLGTTGDDALLVRSLTAGDYQIELHDGWRLEKEATDGLVEVQAELESENPQDFSIADGMTTRVSVAFATDGVPVVLGPPGLLIVDLAVTDSSNRGADAGP